MDDVLPCLEGLLTAVDKNLDNMSQSTVAEISVGMFETTFNDHHRVALLLNAFSVEDHIVFIFY